MGRQINFFLTSDDQKDIDNLLKSVGDLLILPYYYPENSIVARPDTLIRDPKKEGERVFLIRAADFQQMRLRYYKNLGYWLLADDNLPVLHYDRCTFSDNEISRGRLYFQPKYVEDLQWVEKSTEFVKWADGIIAKFRRKLKKSTISLGEYTYEEYAGLHARQWIETNKPQSEMGGGILKF